MTPAITFYESSSWKIDLGFRLTARVGDSRVECFITPLVFEDHFGINDPNLENTRRVCDQNIEKFKKIFRHMIAEKKYSAPNEVAINSGNYLFWSSLA